MTLISKEKQDQLNKLSEKFNSGNTINNNWIDDKIRKKFRNKFKKALSTKIVNDVINRKDFNSIALDFEVCFNNFDIKTVENLVFIKNMKFSINDKKEIKKAVKS